MGFKIFISYSTADSEQFQVEKFATDLQKYPTIDEVLIWEKDSKDNIIGYMNENLEKCDVLLLLCTDNSKKSKSVKLEWGAFLAADKRIIPIFDKVESIPFILKSILGLECKGNLYNAIDEVHQLILKTEESLKQKKKDHEKDTGYCIRCHREILFNRNSPYCRDCYYEWAKYGNQDYVDDYCHKCGKSYGSTINFPLCDKCYRQT